MATETKELTKPKEATPARGGALEPHRDFPLFLGWMRDEFDRMLDRFSRNWPGIGHGNGWRWGVDVQDQDDTVVVRAEAPGFEAGDFDIQVADDRLVLRAAKKVETKGDGGTVREYREQECYESVGLPPGIDKANVEAKYHNGVLTVTLPKTAEGKAKKVIVKAG